MINYLSVDSMPLVALLILFLQFLLNALGQGLLLITSLGIVGQAVGSILDFSFRVHTELGSFHLILGLLILISANTTLLSLQVLRSLNSGIMPVKGQGEGVGRSVDLDDIVLGKEDLTQILSLLGFQGLPLVLLDVELLSINRDLQLAGLGLDPDF